MDTVLANRNSDSPSVEVTTAHNLFAAPIVILYLLSFVSGFSIGVFNPMISTLMKMQGVSDIGIGVNSTIYFATLAVAALILPRFLSNQTYRMQIVAGLIITASSALLYPQLSDYASWCLLRFLMGIGISLYMVNGQTLLNTLAWQEKRSAINGLYTLSFGVGFGLGPVVGAYLFEINALLAFASGAMLLSFVAIACLRLLPAFQSQSVERHDHSVFWVICLALFAIFAYGFAEATLVSIFPLFLLALDAKVEQMGIVFGAFTLGSLLFVYPLTRLSDKIGVEKVLRGILVSGAVLAILLSAQQQLSILFYSIAFLSGAAIGCVYPLAMSYTGSRLRHLKLQSGMSLLTMAFAFGCAAGPVISSIVIGFFNIHHVFTATAVLLLVSFFLSFTFKPQSAKA